MEYFASQDPRSYSLYFDLNVCFRARKVSGAFEKRAPGLLPMVCKVAALSDSTEVDNGDYRLDQQTKVLTEARKRGRILE